MLTLTDLNPAPDATNVDTYGSFALTIVTDAAPIYHMSVHIRLDNRTVWGNDQAGYAFHVVRSVGVDSVSFTFTPLIQLDPLTTYTIAVYASDVLGSVLDTQYKIKTGDLVILNQLWGFESRAEAGLVLSNIYYYTRTLLIPGGLQTQPILVYYVLRSAAPDACKRFSVLPEAMLTLDVKPTASMHLNVYPYAHQYLTVEPLEPFDALTSLLTDFVSAEVQLTLSESETNDPDKLLVILANAQHTLDVKDNATKMVAIQPQPVKDLTVYSVAHKHLRLYPQACHAVELDVCDGS